MQHKLSVGIFICIPNLFIARHVVLECCHSHQGPQLRQVGDVGPSHSSPLLSSVRVFSWTQFSMLLSALPLKFTMSFGPATFSPSHVFCLSLDSYHQGCHVSPNLLS